MAARPRRSPAASRPLFVWVAPVVLAPIFNRFEALPQGSATRTEVLALGERAGVEIGEVYRVDASRRVTSLNAYVDGLGSTKRVVLYDNLLAEADREEVASVVAHELGHVAHDDIPRGLAYVLIVAPLGMLFTRELGTSLARRSGADPATPAAIPAYLLALSLAALVLNVPGNQLSRKVEASADAFALELTGDPRALIDLQLRLAGTNLSDPDPPDLYEALFATHPPTVERIGAALAYERRAPAASAPPRSASPEPVRGDREPAVEVVAGAPAQLALGQRGVDRDAVDLAEARRRHLGLELGPGCGRDPPAELEDGGLDAGADVVGPAAAALGGGEEGRGDVAREDVVAGLPAIAEHARPTTVAQGAAEDRDHARLAVRVLARPVDVAESQGDRLEAVDAAVEGEIALCGVLGLP